MRKHTRTGRALRVLFVVFLVLPFLGIFAQAALAHHEDITASTDCIQPDGTWDFTYTVTGATSVGALPEDLQNQSVQVWFVWDGPTPTSNTPPNFGSIGAVLDQTAALVWNGQAGVFPSFSGDGTAPSGTSKVTIWAVPTAPWSDGTPAGGSARWAEVFNETECPTPTTTTTQPSMPGTITVVKITEGGTGTFPFTSQSLGAFDLTTTEANTPVSKLFAGLSPGIYGVWEGALGDGWSLTSVSCSNGQSPTLINLHAGESVTCTFTNSYTKVLPTTVTRPPETLPFTGSSSSGVGGVGIALLLLGGLVLLSLRKETVDG